MDDYYILHKIWHFISCVHSHRSLDAHSFKLWQCELSVLLLCVTCKGEHTCECGFEVWQHPLRLARGTAIKNETSGFLDIRRQKSYKICIQMAYYICRGDMHYIQHDKKKPLTFLYSVCYNPKFTFRINLCLINSDSSLLYCVDKCWKYIVNIFPEDFISVFVFTSRITHSKIHPCGCLMSKRILILSWIEASNTYSCMIKRCSLNIQ